MEGKKGLALFKHDLIEKERTERTRYFPPIQSPKSKREGHQGGVQAFYCPYRSHG